jgi:hypothetical protein
MAHSNWGHQVREGFEGLDFLSALRDEDRRLNDPGYARTAGRWLYDMTYIRRASYGVQLKRYIERFAPERVHVYLFEEFFCSGLPLYQHLLRSLGVDQAHRPAEKAYNKAGTIRSSFIRRALTERMAWKEPLKRVIPQQVRSRLMATLARVNRIDKEPAPISPEARSYFNERIASDVELLSGLIGRDLKSIWGIDG